MRALRVAVSGAILGAGGVLDAVVVALLVHLDEVDRAVQATPQVTHIHIESELAVLQLEHLVRVLAVHDIQARAKVRRVVPLGHEVQRHAVSATGGVDAVGLLVVRAVDPALHRALRRVRARSGTPSVIVHVAVLTILVHPPPVGVDHHRGLLRLAAAGGAVRLHPHLRVRLLLHPAHLLRCSEAQGGHAQQRPHHRHAVQSGLEARGARNPAVT
mmetsp:Transcript_84612/g.236831  ORF Transcript_84612/g.236831 Transcript_84612/m.236831 type:complete len:215 (-) Transcript_84612:12-656(-)